MEDFNGTEYDDILVLMIIGIIVISRKLNKIRKAIEKEK